MSVASGEDQPSLLLTALLKNMRAGIALGSNIEPRLFYLQAARRRLFSLHYGTQPILCSKVYETSPVGCPAASPPFLNAALELSSEMRPHELLDSFKSIERDLGRSPNREKNSPRTIDVDLLYYDDIALSEPDLTVPHPRIARRRFVLRPLADIRPKLVLPHFARNVEELLENLQNDENVEVYCNVIY
jgi:2-amino-4-hydroxy-6-hydroxymethyldihydropteridine diphosphokinase